MKILIHTCCAPCLVGPYDDLIKNNKDITAFYYNPNVMPYREFRKRLISFRDFCIAKNIPFILNEEYTLETVLEQMINRGDTPRCLVCYRLRLFEAARVASEKSFDAFTTTLSVSPYQDHDLIQKAGEEASGEYDVSFIYKDWRPVFKTGHEDAKKFDLYFQKYCGCIFSEEERFRPSARKRIARKRKRNNP